MRRHIALLILAATLQSPLDARALDAQQPMPPLLTAYHWDLTDARNADGTVALEYFPKYPNDTTLRVTITPEYIGSYAGCNSAGANVAYDHGYLVRTPQSLQTMTLLGCRSDIDAAMSRFFAGDMHVFVEPGSPPHLRLDAGGTALMFVGDPTDETRYGSEGEVMYFEVAPHTVRCSVRGRPERDCLQLRLLRYGEGMAEIVEGPWKVVYEPIDGFEPLDGVHMKIAVARFQPNDPAHDGSIPVYLLRGVYFTDGMVEYDKRRARRERP